MAHAISPPTCVIHQFTRIYHLDGACLDKLQKEVMTMPAWYQAELRRETEALNAFRQAMIERASKDENPYIRALAASNGNTEYRSVS